MPYLLHIETSTDVCSVAISKNDILLSLQEDATGYSHAAKITLLIEAALQAAKIQMSDLHAVALSSGPGSYTSLRIGTSTAKGICYALDIPLIIVDTLEALAQATHHILPKENALYFPMIDARRMEVYTAGFDEAGIQQENLHAKIIDAESFNTFLQKKILLIFSGNGAPKCEDILAHENTLFIPVVCSAKHLISLAFAAFQAQVFADIAYYTPTYFKSPNITKAKKVL